MSDNGNEYKPDYSVLKSWPVSRWEWPKIVVYVPWTSTLSYADEVNPHIIEIARHGTPFIHLPYGFADRMRNEAGKELLDTDYSHILMLDADHVHQADIVHLLAKHVIADPEKLIIGGLNFKRTPPYSPCVAVVKDNKIYRPEEWEPGLMEMDRVGFGAVLIAREVFERVEWPWFVNDPHYETQTLGSHDNYFCEKAQAAGIKVWCDFTLTSPHISTHRVTENTWRTFMEMNKATSAMPGDILEVEDAKT